MPASATTPAEAARINREMGRLLRARRAELGMTQAGLAQQVGVSQQQIVKYEKGSGRLPIDSLIKLCRALRIQPSLALRGLDEYNLETVGFAERESAPYQADDGAGADDAAALVKAFSRIKDKTVRQSVVDLVTALSAQGPEQVAKSRRAKDED